ncbi:hypothetical protein [Nocardiopsis sp. CA-288880]|uniref:hypothetical protein n=1 Tax=Nocardiopsis sp. CA-288880 TaxID=3239995 RepID=UPI003D973619
MSTTDAGRRRYRREHPRVTNDPGRYADLSDTAVNRGRLRHAARTGNEAARELLAKWENEARADEAPNVGFGSVADGNDAA